MMRPARPRARARKRCDVYSFLVLILVLLVRPHGIFGQRERRA